MAGPLLSSSAATPAGDRWRRLVREAPRRELVVLAAIVALSVLLRLISWNEIADGDRDRYVRTTLFGAFAAAAVWLLVRLQAGRGSWVPLLAAAGVLLFGDAVHYGRLANPMTRGAPVLAFTASFADEAVARRQWKVEGAGGGEVRFEPGAMILESPPQTRAYVSARLGSVPDVHVTWWLPVGLAERERTERLGWRASVHRTGNFYVVTELRHLLIQAVSYGLHVTYPDERGTAQGYEIADPAGTDGQPHEWLLTRDSRQIVLSIDGKKAWSVPQREPWNQIRLGETKLDAEHGGSMRVEAVTYTSALARG